MTMGMANGRKAVPRRLFTRRLHLLRFSLLGTAAVLLILALPCTGEAADVRQNGNGIGYGVRKTKNNNLRGREELLVNTVSFYQEPIRELKSSGSSGSGHTHSNGSSHGGSSSSTNKHSSSSSGHSGTSTQSEEPKSSEEEEEEESESEVEESEESAESDEDDEESVESDEDDGESEESDEADETSEESEEESMGSESEEGDESDSSEEISDDESDEEQAESNESSEEGNEIAPSGQSEMVRNQGSNTNKAGSQEKAGDTTPADEANNDDEVGDGDAENEEGNDDTTETNPPDDEETNDDDTDDTVPEGDNSGSNTQQDDEIDEIIEIEAELEREEKVARGLGSLGFFLAVGAMVFTAHQMSENPDGIYASVCRLAITISGCALKIVFMPCRKLMGSHHPYHGHMPVSTVDYGYRDRGGGFELS